MGGHKKSQSIVENNIANMLGNLYFKSLAPSRNLISRGLQKNRNKERLDASEVSEMYDNVMGGTSPHKRFDNQSQA